MKPLHARMLEDRYLRDTARALVEADLDHLRADFAHKGLGTRATDRIKEGALEIYEDAVDIAGDNRGVLMALLAAVAVWFTRNPILEFLGFAEPDESGDETGDITEHQDTADR